MRERRHMAAAPAAASVSVEGKESVRQSRRKTQGMQKEVCRLSSLAVPDCVTAGRSGLRVVSFIYLHLIARATSSEAL